MQMNTSLVLVILLVVARECAGTSCEGCATNFRAYCSDFELPAHWCEGGDGAGISCFDPAYGQVCCTRASCPTLAQPCPAGSTGPDGACSACVPGTFKSSTGSSPCTQCTGGKFSTQTGATSDVCIACASNSNSLLGSNEASDCTCNRGYTGTPHGEYGCMACVNGKYKVVQGDGLCKLCLAGKFKNTGNSPISPARR